MSIREESARFIHSKGEWAIASNKSGCEISSAMTKAIQEEIPVMYDKSAGVRREVFELPGLYLRLPKWCQEKFPKDKLGAIYHAIPEEKGQERKSIRLGMLLYMRSDRNWGIWYPDGTPEPLTGIYPSLSAARQAQNEYVAKVLDKPDFKAFPCAITWETEKRLRTRRASY